MAGETVAAPAGAQGAAPGAPDGQNGTIAAPEKAAPRSWSEAFAAARATVAARGAAASGAAGGGEDLGDGSEIALEDLGGEDAGAAGEGEDGAIDGETAGEGAEAGEGDEGAEDELIVDLGPRREGEEPLRIVAEDKATADHLRSVMNRAQAVEQAEALRNYAAADRQMAEELRFDVALDPAGFVVDQIRSQDDAVHLTRFLLTRPGVLDAVKEWALALAEHPEALPAEARNVNTERFERRQKVEGMITAEREQTRNARAVLAEATSTIDGLVPEGWTPQQKTMLFRDVLRDLQDISDAEKLQAMDPRRVPKVVKDRLAALGIQPRTAGGKTKAAGNGGKQPVAGKDAAHRTGPTGEELVRVAGQRRRAAGAGPGVGSPAASIPKPPPGTLLTARNGKPSVFDHIRQNLSRLRRAP